MIPTPSATLDPSPKPTGPAPPEHQTALRRRAKALGDKVCHPVSIVTMMSLSFALLWWSLWIRLPSSELSQAVQARGISHAAGVDDLNEWPLSTDSTEELSRQLDVADERLVADRAQVGAWVERVRSVAATRGWLVHPEIADALASSNGGEPMMRYPVRLRLEFDPEATTHVTSSAFDGLMDVMREMRVLNKKAEWLRFQLSGGPKGASQGTIELELWGRDSTNAHAKTPAE